MEPYGANMATIVIDLVTTEDNTINLSAITPSIDYDFSVNNFKTENGTTKLNEVVGDYYIKLSGISTDSFTYKLYYDVGDGTKQELSLETTGEYTGYYKSPVELGIQNQYTHNYILSISAITPIATTATCDVNIDLGCIQKVETTPTQDTNLAITPELATGMIPIAWDTTQNAWVKAQANTNRADFNWYDYANKKWANVATTTNYATYNAAAVGTVIPYTDIVTMFVWIPRFVYKIPSAFYHQTLDESDFVANTTDANLVDVHFSKTEANGGDSWDSTISVVDYSNTSSNASQAWTTLSAFNFGTTHLDGFWMAKFQASNSSGDIGSASAGTMDNIYVVPSKYVKTNFDYDTTFSYCRNMELSSIYGWNQETPSLQTDGSFTTNTNGVDTHLTKNSEWAAVAFLAHSQYGQNKTAINHYSDSSDPGKISGGNADQTTVFTTNVNQSTTGNPYGVYDMSSTVWDQVAAYIGQGASNGSTTLYNSASKYKDNYASTSNIDSTWTRDSIYALFENINGAAIWESSANGNVTGSAWFLGRSSIGIVDSTYNRLFLTRGGSYSNNGQMLSSVFAFGYAYAMQQNTALSFRPVIAVNSNL